MKNTSLILLLLFPFLFFSQTPTIEWQGCYGRPGFEGFKSIAITSDGGYIMSGGSGSFSISSSDFLLYKINATGTIEWEKRIGGNGYDYLPLVKQTSDGGYIVAGASDSDISGDKTDNSKGYNDIWILKLNELGIILWQKTIGGNLNDFIVSIEQTVDGGYILGSDSSSNASGDKSENRIGNSQDFWIVKLNSVGTIEWENTIGGDGIEEGGYTHQTPDGGYIVGGSTLSPLSGDKTENNIGDKDFWIIKLDNTGTIVWDNTIGGDNYEYFYNIQSTTNGYVIGGVSLSGISGDKTENTISLNPNSTDIWILKLDLDGSILWQNTIGGNGDEILNSISLTIDGGIILGSSSKSNISADKTENCRGNYDYWLVKVGSNGLVLWDKTIGGSNTEENAIILQTRDGGYIVGGLSNSTISGDKTTQGQGIPDYWIVKLSPENLTTANFTTKNVQLYPNPTKNTVYINFPQVYKNINCTVFNVLGQVMQEQMFTNLAEIHINIDQAKGVYFVNVVNENNEKIVFKVIKE